MFRHIGIYIILGSFLLIFGCKKDQVISVIPQEYYGKWVTPDYSQYNQMFFNINESGFCELHLVTHGGSSLDINSSGSVVIDGATLSFYPTQPDTRIDFNIYAPPVQLSDYTLLIDTAYQQYNPVKPATWHMCLLLKNESGDDVSQFISCYH